MGTWCRAANCVASCAEHMLLLPLGVQDSSNVQIVTELCAGGDLQKYVEVRLRSRVASHVGWCNARWKPSLSMLLLCL